MDLETFDDFMYHNDEISYINQGFSVDFGGGYSFATDGGFPVLREINLYFTGYKWYTKVEGFNEVIDYETNKNINNMGNLREFYKRHLTYKSFIYNHPTEGELKVRFAEPLTLPRRVKGGGGVCEDFTIKLRQVF
jgi:phage-related protein